MAENTRSKDSSSYGAAKTFSENVLPTFGDVAQRCMAVRADLQLKTDRERVPKADVFKQVGEEILGLWLKASIPTISLKSVIRKIEKYYNDGSKAAHTNEFKKFESLKPHFLTFVHAVVGD